MAYTRNRASKKQQEIDWEGIRKVLLKYRILGKTPAGFNFTSVRLKAKDKGAVYYPSMHPDLLESLLEAVEFDPVRLNWALFQLGGGKTALDNFHNEIYTNIFDNDGNPRVPEYFDFGTKPWPDRAIVSNNLFNHNNVLNSIAFSVSNNNSCVGSRKENELRNLRAFLKLKGFDNIQVRNWTPGPDRPQEPEVSVQFKNAITITGGLRSAKITVAPNTPESVISDFITVANTFNSTAFNPDLFTDYGAEKKKVPVGYTKTGLEIKDLQSKGINYFCLSLCRLLILTDRISSDDRIRELYISSNAEDWVKYRVLSTYTGVICRMSCASIRYSSGIGFKLAWEPNDYTQNEGVIAAKSIVELLQRYKSLKQAVEEINARRKKAGKNPLKIDFSSAEASRAYKNIFGEKLPADNEVYKDKNIDYKPETENPYLRLAEGSLPKKFVPVISGLLESAMLRLIQGLHILNTASSLYIESPTPPDETAYSQYDGINPFKFDYLSDFLKEVRPGAARLTGQSIKCGLLVGFRKAPARSASVVATTLQQQTTQKSQPPTVTKSKFIAKILGTKDENIPAVIDNDEDAKKFLALLAFENSVAELEKLKLTINELKDTLDLIEKTVKFIWLKPEPKIQVTAEIPGVLTAFIPLTYGAARKFGLPDWPWVNNKYFQSLYLGLAAPSEYDEYQKNLKKYIDFSSKKMPENVLLYLEFDTPVPLFYIRPKLITKLKDISTEELPSATYISDLPIVAVKIPTSAGVNTFLDWEIYTPDTDIESYLKGMYSPPKELRLTVKTLMNLIDMSVAPEKPTEKGELIAYDEEGNLLPPPWQRQGKTKKPAYQIPATYPKPLLTRAEADKIKEGIAYAIKQSHKEIQSGKIKFND